MTAAGAPPVARSLPLVPAAQREAIQQRLAAAGALRFREPPGAAPDPPSAAPSQRTPQPDATERELVRLAQAGSHAAFDALVERYQAALQTYALRLMGHAEDAQEKTQDALLRAWLALPRTTPDLRFGAWVYRILTNTCLDELRHRKLLHWHELDAAAEHRPNAPLFVAADSPEREALASETAGEVRAVLDALPPKYRAALVLREHYDQSYDQIAVLLDTTRAAVKSLLHRARIEFRVHPRAAGLRPEGAPAAAPEPRVPLPPGVRRRLRRDGRARYEASWYRGGRPGHIGTYDTPEEAARALEAWRAAQTPAQEGR